MPFAVVVLFFLSSRRRHPIYWRDWSSDVCSSDLPGFSLGEPFVAGAPYLDSWLGARTYSLLVGLRQRARRVLSPVGRARQRDHAPLPADRQDRESVV